MFNRKKSAEASEPIQVEEFVDPAEAKKGRPTPKRKEAEAANRRPLVPTDRTVAAKTDKESRRRERALASEAMRTGDEAHMPLQHKGRERRFIRDFTDARISVGEFLLPVLLLVLVSSLFAGRNVMVTFVIMLVVYGLMLVAAIDAFFAVRKCKKLVIAKWGPGSWPRGAGAYLVSRLIQLRPLRMPKPQVARGQHPH